MIPSSSQDLAKPSQDGISPPTVTENGVIANVDFALLLGKQLLVYGWVLGFHSSVQSAFIGIGDVQIDLMQTAIRVRRPDVSKHFAMAPDHDEHGFYALFDLLEEVSSVDPLTLSVRLSTGKAAVSRWPIEWNDADAAAMIGAHASTLNRLLTHLPRQEAKRLIEFGKPALGMAPEYARRQALPFPLRFDVDVCCILENQLLAITGWLYDPMQEFSAVEVTIDDRKYNLLEGGLRYARADIYPELHLDRRRYPADQAEFCFVHPISHYDEELDEVVLTFSARDVTERLNRPVNNRPREALRDLLQHVQKAEPEVAFDLVEQVAEATNKIPALRALSAFFESVRHGIIERLPTSIQHANPRYLIHVDQAIPVADVGIFLMGWFNAAPTLTARIVCHCGAGSFVVSDCWSRHSRPDVTSHLISLGIQSTIQTHGFACYVPLSSADEPYSLSVEPVGGATSRMRVAVRDKAESPMQSVRALVTSFNSGSSDLRFLLDHHIGPAVKAAWEGRQTPMLTQPVLHFGTQISAPLVSMIVPLYGRYDFAEVQMALFSSDPEFQKIELIYVVDDPEIYAEFKRACPDFYGMFNVPFTLVYPGVNLGFSGANNFGVEAARGEYLLFVNSDVMPKRIQWVSDLLRIYQGLKDAGALGVKLLYEDGSVQHAGISFRRYEAWGNLWVNDHPKKGQSPLKLEGAPEVDAVTAACMLIKAELFHEAGRFSEDYIIGDFEDSDLCLRLSSTGRRNYVALDVELYHLERQSQNRMGDDTWRTNLTLYNCWVHNERWGKYIHKRVSDRRFEAGRELVLQSDNKTPQSRDQPEEAARN